MKAEIITISAVMFENGHILIGRFRDHAWVKWDDGSIHEYTANEMRDCYGFDINNIFNNDI